MKQISLLKIAIILYIAKSFLHFVQNEHFVYIECFISCIILLLLLLSSKDVVSRDSKILVLLLIPFFIAGYSMSIYLPHSGFSYETQSYFYLYWIRTICFVTYRVLLLAAFMMTNCELKIKSLCLAYYVIGFVPFSALPLCDASLEIVSHIMLLMIDIAALGTACFFCYNWNDTIPFEQQAYKNGLRVILPYGTIDRKTFVLTWIVTSIVVGLSVGLIVSAVLIRNAFWNLEYLRLMTCFVNPPCYLFIISSIWVYCAQSARRCHAKGKSGWFQFVPFFNLYLLLKK